jgi:hypothetical protein
MTKRRKLVLATTAGAALAVAIAAGGAGAIAASGVLSPKQESQAVIDDAADRLGVEPSELGDALKGALESRVDAAVEAGRLTEAQGDALKARIESGTAPFLLGGFGAHGPGHFGHAGHGHLSAAATYLDLDEAELREQLADGRTLAEVAKAESKSVDGLVRALVGEAESRLDQAVANGRLTQKQADELAEGLEERMTDLVHGEQTGRGLRHGFGGDRPTGVGPPGFGRHGPHA